MRMSGLQLDAMIDELTPVRRIAPMRGLAIALGVAAAVTLAVAAGVGLRPDVAAWRPDEMVVLRGGALLLLGIATIATVAASARPAIGPQRTGWRWALAAMALFPLSSLALLIGGEAFPAAVLTAETARYCIGISVGGGLAIGGALTLWLRQGAVTDLRRAGWLVGLGAGAFGTFAYSLHCPSDSVHYIALWYSLALALCAAIGRLAVPRLLRW